MKRILIKLIDIYQITPMHCHSMCRFTPTCSEYMKECIKIYGVKGIFKGLKRILRCHPFGKIGFDPVEKRRKDMKKIISAFMACLLLTGCDLKYNFNDEYLYTTMYPLEYAANYLYKDYAKVSSVYPMGSDKSYTVTEKKKDAYAEGNTFIYSGLADEAYLARDLLNKNGALQLIDATKGMTKESDISVIWLDPSNYLMLCSNIKSSLIDYNDNAYIKESIEENYKQLNEKVSELDVLLYNIGKNGNYNTILTTNNVLNYLTKYNINVISIDSNNEQIDKAYSDASKLISNKSIQYLYYLEGDEFNERQQKLISYNSLVTIKINDLYTLNDDEKNENKDYLSIMNDIINDYKKELYKK